MKFHEIAFYIRCHRGAGYYKYFIAEDYDIPEVYKTCTEEKTVSVRLVSTHKKHTRFERMTYCNGVITPEENLFKNIFKSHIDYFLYMESIDSPVKKNKQYKFELNQVRNKYPEYFL